MASDWMVFLLVISIISSSVFSLPTKPKDDETNNAIGALTNKWPDSMASRNLNNGNDDDHDDDREDEVCVICRDDFLEEPRAQVDCGHCYHLNCLADYWRLSQDFDECLICRKKIRLANGQDFGSLCLDQDRKRFHEEQLEVAENKMRLGLLAGVKQLPDFWQKPPLRWYGPGVYFASIDMKGINQDDYA